ncbi:MAG TPA: flagellar assembly protein FliX [Nitrobacter sp.]|nr:flagellar assembly protein FliX [Nitrobacter sp.]
MRIESAARLASPAGSKTARSGASGFTVSTDTAAAATQAEAAPAAPSLDAVLLLQEALPPAERRRRAVRRGGSLLALLDELRLSLLSGEAPVALPGRIGALLGERREPSGDRSLDEVLDAVELRAEVEVAKFDARRNR